MKKYVFTVGLIFLLFAGYAVANHTLTEEHVVVFDPPPTVITVDPDPMTTTLQDTDTIQHDTTTVVSTETVTVTAPTTTAPPPTTTAPPTTTIEEPPPPVGTLVTLVNARFVCTGPLTSYGPLPITVSQTLDNNHDNADHPRGAIDIESGCRGDGDPTTDDLIIHQYGNGRELGAASDPIVIFPGARDLVITGFTDCGFIDPGSPTSSTDEAHQDGFDVRGGINILIHDYEMGDWETQNPTCHGAGALAYFSAFLNSATPKDNPNMIQNVICLRCKFVGSKGGLDPEAGAAGRGAFLVQSTNSGFIDSCFSANIPAEIRHHTTSVNGAINPIPPTLPGSNLLIDRNAGGTQPSPLDCDA